MLIIIFLIVIYFFFFKQKTAYEMRISDWSSDVCSSDLRLAVNTLVAKELISEDPIVQKVAAISCGIYNGTPVLDLDYDEDSNAGADANFVLTSDGNIAEAQATAEGECFDEENLLRLLRLARIGCNQIFAAQDAAVTGAVGR